MLLSLDGISVGDAVGMRILVRPERLETKKLPDGPWRWSDDTHMALSVVENLALFGAINQDKLIEAFATRYNADPYRGYGFGMRRLLAKFGQKPWMEAAQSLFGGTGSFGNGAAMRAPPIGACFAGDLETSAAQARLSAQVTHAHPEGQAGAIAVAVAAALAATPSCPRGNGFIERILSLTPSGLTHDGLAKALHIPHDQLQRAIDELGTGHNISSQDTVPFCIWVAAHHLDDFEEAMWATATGLEDADTTCAIVGGIVALSAKNIPQQWLQAREGLPEMNLATSVDA